MSGSSSAAALDMSMSSALMFTGACRPSCSARHRNLRVTVLVLAQVVPYLPISMSAYRGSFGTHFRRARDAGPSKFEGSAEKSRG